MKIERESAEGRNLFTGYGEGWVEVNRKRVRDVAAVRAVLGTASPEQDLLLRVQRGDVLQYVALQASQP